VRPSTAPGNGFVPLDFAAWPQLDLYYEPNVAARSQSLLKALPPCLPGGQA